MGLSVDITNWSDEWDSALKPMIECQQQYENKKNKMAGIFSLAVGLLLFPKYKSKYKESARRMRDVATRQQAMSITLKDHYINVTHPQIKKAIDDAMSMPYTPLTFSSVEGSPENLKDRAYQEDNILNKRYCCTSDGCEANYDISASNAIANTSNSRGQYLKRRYQRRVEVKRSFVKKAHVSTFKPAGSIFQLLDGAGSIYSNIYKNAEANLSGAVSSLGYGIGSIGTWGK